MSTGTGRTEAVDERVAVTAQTVYVMIATDGSGKRAIPALVLEALGPVAPLRS